MTAPHSTPPEPDAFRHPRLGILCYDSAGRLHQWPDAAPISPWLTADKAAELCAESVALWFREGAS